MSTLITFNRFLVTAITARMAERSTEVTTGIFLMMLGLMSSGRLRSSSRSLTLGATGLEAAWLEAAGLEAVSMASVARGSCCWFRWELSLAVRFVVVGFRVLLGGDLHDLVDVVQVHEQALGAAF